MMRQAPRDRSPLRACLRRLRLAAALLLAFGLGSAPASAADLVRIGVGAPLQGGDAIFGKQITTGVEQAIADINASGGFIGRRGRVTEANDDSDPKRGVEVAKGFVKAGIHLVVGHFTSAVTVPASAVYAEAGALDITPSATGPLVTDRGLPRVFRMCGREDQQAGVATSYLLAKHYAKIAIVHDRTAAGKALADEVRKALAAHGIADVFYGSVAEGTQDLGGLIGRMRQAGTQIVFWGGGASGAGRLARRLDDDDAHIPLLGGSATATDEFANQAGPGAEGTLTIFARDPQSRPAAADLLRKLKARKKDTGAYVFYAYAAVQVMRQAAVATHSMDPATLAAHMHSGATFQTVLGPIAFDEKGDPKMTDLTVFVWHKGATGHMGLVDPADS